MNNIELKICCICSNPIEAEFTENGDAYWLDGHNALPVADGRCCSKCNDNIVIPTRLINAGLSIEESISVMIGRLAQKEMMNEDE
tara:strand:+ start:944 stop:1198 length:255 start_codon:yes stop_codon:yes gene_type:complete